MRIHNSELRLKTASGLFYRKGSLLSCGSGWILQNIPLPPLERDGIKDLGRTTHLSLSPIRQLQRDRVRDGADAAHVALHDHVLPAQVTLS